MSIFNLTDEKMKETSSTFTAHEIYQQPATWRKTCAQLAACKDQGLLAAHEGAQLAASL